MASQIAHIIYAKKYFEAIENGTLPFGAEKLLPNNFNRDEFLLGAIFPDIRRVAPDLRRRETHMILRETNLDFSYLDSFHAGWKFHIYCDMRREEILNRYRFYDLDGTTDFWNNATKYLEDEIVYDEYNNWEKLVNYLNDPPMIKTGVDVSRETFEFWYAIIAKFIEQKPDSRTISVFLSKQSSLVKAAKEIVVTVDKLRQNDKVIELLKKVKDEIIGV